jgi:Urocanase Rossmann-like domain
VTDQDLSSETQPNQSAVYRRYLQLQSIRGERFLESSADGLAGLLLACVGFGLEGAELALATTISGGTFLGIDLSTEHLKAAVRNGSCDFMVNTLDESLRVLKNELRKKKALSVGLLGDAAAILPAMVERGVQPDLIVDTTASDSETDVSIYGAALLQLVERGAVLVDKEAANHSLDNGFSEVNWTAASIADLRRMDESALQQLPPEDSVRRRWLQQSSGCFHRQRPLQRVLGLRPEELQQFLSVLKGAASANEFQSPAFVEWQTADGSKNSISLQ